MPLPALSDEGFLPAGVHDASVQEVQIAFGSFRSTERRPSLWAKFLELLKELNNCGFAEAVLVDGSFVTASSNPNDIDLVLVLRRGHDFSMELSPDQYRSLAPRQVRKRFGFDILVVEDRTEGLENAIEFFQQVKQRPGCRKGLVRIVL